jgi:hypothetical protein
MPAPKGLGAVYLVDPEKAGRELRVAICRHNGDLGAVGAELGAARPTLQKWLARFPGGKNYRTCREWLDATYRQQHDPRPIGRRRQSTDGQTNGA